MNKLLLIISVQALLFGCNSQSSLTGDSYSRNEARNVQNIRLGVIEDIRPVKIEGTKSSAGGVVGGVVGAIGGSTVGGGRGAVIATTVGTALGSMLGGEIEEMVTSRDGIEVTIKEDNGNTKAIVQEVDPKVKFSIGQRVRILYIGSTYRVAPVGTLK